eukprot:scaffold3462_cov214-Prasinococcus_capsulatus_cf.AAC.1
MQTRMIRSCVLPLAPPVRRKASSTVSVLCTLLFVAAHPDPHGARARVHEKLGAVRRQPTPPPAAGVQGYRESDLSCRPPRRSAPAPPYGRSSATQRRCASRCWPRQARDANSSHPNVTALRTLRHK